MVEKVVALLASSAGQKIGLWPGVALLSRQAGKPRSLEMAPLRDICKKSGPKKKKNRYPINYNDVTLLTTLHYVHSIMVHMKRLLQ